MVIRSLVRDGIFSAIAIHMIISGIHGTVLSPWHLIGYGAVMLFFIIWYILMRFGIIGGY